MAYMYRMLEYLFFANASCTISGTQLQHCTYKMQGYFTILLAFGLDKNILGTKVTHVRKCEICFLAIIFLLLNKLI